MAFASPNVPYFQRATELRDLPAFFSSLERSQEIGKKNHTITGDLSTGLKSLPRLTVRGLTASAIPMSITMTWSSS